MLQLFVPVPLNTLQECSKSHLLLCSESFLLLDECIVDLCFDLSSLSNLTGIAFFLKLFCLFNLLGRYKNVNLLFHIHEFFRQLNFTCEFTLDALLELLNL